MDSMFASASAFDQDLGWCVDDDVLLDDAFSNTLCASTSCGVTQSSACGRRLQERRAVPRAGMSAAAAPLEALGVSAKFSNGKSATARYYVALELPGSGGHLPRDAQRRAAARTAAALKAPPLVDAWLAVLAAEVLP